MINVTKSFLPPREEYDRYLDRIWDSHWLTNNGPLAKELESKLKEYLGVEFLRLTSNGTIAIQLVLKSLGITKKVITTPFSYVATTSSILWENCTPVFADIDPETLCIDPDRVEAVIDDDTEAVLATHVFGYPCDVERLEAIGKKHGIKIIYDAAHAFGCVYDGRSLLDYGDAATCSFHATKLFHTGEGGCVIVHTQGLDSEISLKRSFGHNGDEHFTLGVNGKNSEFHAAMGLSVLPHTKANIEERRILSQHYNAQIEALPLQRPAVPKELEYNYAYYPVLLKNETILIAAMEALKAKEIVPRRYFWPSLNRLPYLKIAACGVSEDIASRILCLPLYNTLTKEEIDGIVQVLAGVLR